MESPLVLALLGVAHGTSLARFAGYNGGPLSDEARVALHRSLDHLVNVANSRAAQSESARAKP